MSGIKLLLIFSILFFIEGIFSFRLNSWSLLKVKSFPQTRDYFIDLGIFNVAWFYATLFMCWKCRLLCDLGIKLMFRIEICIFMLKVVLVVKLCKMRNFCETVNKMHEAICITNICFTEMVSRCWFCKLEQMNEIL